ncbi:MAG: hypothetical protein ACREMU_04415, partial [Gemmatimonadaceae bacterium]
RPVTASSMTDAPTRAALGDLGVVRGALFAEGDGATGIARLGRDGPDVDTIAAIALGRAMSIPARTASDDEGIDPAPATMLAYLRCPAQQLAVARGLIAATSLDSLCKLR